MQRTAQQKRFLSPKAKHAARTKSFPRAAVPTPNRLAKSDLKSCKESKFQAYTPQTLNPDEVACQMNGRPWVQEFQAVGGGTYASGDMLWEVLVRLFFAKKRKCTLKCKFCCHLIVLVSTHL